MTDLDPRLQNRTRRLASIWSDYTSRPMPWPQADRWMAVIAKESRFGKQDRQFYGNQFFALCRVVHRFLAASTLTRATFATEADFRDHVLAFTPESWLKGLVPALNEVMVPVSVGITSLGGPLLAGMEHLQSWAAQQPEGFSAMLYAGLPPWAWPHFELKAKSNQHPWHVAAFLEAQKTRPLLWLRCQKGDATDRIKAQLEADGFPIVEQRQHALGLTPGKSLSQNPLYLNGAVEIQDISSQQIGEKAGVIPGQLVWDVCAGGGGKTMQIASALNGKGHVWASDIRGHKLEDIRDRAKRAGFSNVTAVKHDATQPFALPPQVAARSGFDVVLVDAPCSAIGTWRRSADGLLRPFGIEELVPLQSAILRKAAGAVRPGGTLVYATCSWAIAENEAIVAAFLRENNGFQLKSETYAGVPEFNGDSIFVAVLAKKGP